MRFTTNGIMLEPSIYGGCKVSFHTLDAQYNEDLLHKYEGKPYEVVITEKKGKRSLDANAYMWVLAGKISNHPDILLSKEEVYKKAIKDYGVSTVIPIKDDLMKDILRWHTSNGLGNSFEIIGACKNFEGYTNVHLFYGSSQYDKVQMSALIDGIVADAKELGIDTLTPAELEQMKGEWNG